MTFRNRAPTTPKLNTSSPSKVALVCPNDWDKRKALAATNCTPDSYGERQKKKRRGQDTLIRNGQKRSGKMGVEKNGSRFRHCRRGQGFAPSGSGGDFGVVEAAGG
jgi:hypothetical protein